MDIHYNIELLTYWHCGSGLAAGADVDALVIKDNNGLPYVPGKTVKGLMREAVEDIVSFKYAGDSDSDKRIAEKVVETFGFFDGKSADLNKDKRADMTRGKAFFTNAELPKDIQATIVTEKLQPYMFATVSNTAINADGVAEEHSLRKTEVAVPCLLEGYVLGLPDCEEFLKIIEDAFRYIKRLGQNRNRGLGRCSFSIKK